MKKLLTLLLLTITFISGFTQTSFAQCSIDSSQTQPGIHPDTLVNATANQFYSQDVTFVMITDTLGLTISNFLIQAINGLPLGMQWTCNNSANGCNYNPAQNLYGCVSIYGTPVLPGAYPLSITVVATVALIGNQTFNFNSNLLVDPASISNTGFTLTNALGCAPLTVGFSSNLGTQDYYHWDFGNGDSSLLENPADVTYTNPGDFIITQTTIADTNTYYYLTSIKIDSIPNNAGILDTPDMYILLKNQSGTTVYDSRPAITNTNPPYTFSIQNLQLSNQTYVLQVWDEDSGITAPDDPLGTISFQGNDSTGIAYATVSGASGRLKLTYNITIIHPQTLITTDTIHVYPNAITPIITASGPLSFCDGDTVFLTSSNPTGNQWYKNGNLLVGDTSHTLAVTAAGNYFDISTNSFGCSDTSSSLQLSVNPPPPYPNFAVNGNVLDAAVFGTFTFQWILNDTAISGATAMSYSALVSGNYRLQITDVNGCSRKSFPINIVVTGMHSNAIANKWNIYPNPAKEEVAINIGADMLSTQISIRDLLGNERYNTEVKPGKLLLDISTWNKGIYFIHLQSAKHSEVLKLLVE